MRQTVDARPWSTFHVRRRRRLTPPLRPDPAVCDAVASLVADKCDRALLCEFFSSRYLHAAASDIGSNPEGIRTLSQARRSGAL